MAPDIECMLAERGLPPSLDGWVVEPKLDGLRARLAVDGGPVRLRTRTGRDVTAAVPGAARLRGRRLALDGALVPSACRGRGSTRLGASPTPAQRLPTVFVAFDLLWLDGADLVARPYATRRAMLEGLDLPGAGLPVLPSLDPYEAPVLISACGQHGLGEVVLKRLDAPYRPGERCPAWRQVTVAAWRELVEATQGTGGGENGSRACAGQRPAGSGQPGGSPAATSADTAATSGVAMPWRAAARKTAP